VIEAARLMAGKGIGILAVCHVGNKLVGVLSERDIIGALAEQAERITTMTVNEIYIRKVVTCGLQDDPHVVMRTMTERGFRYMPVVEYGVLKGLISSRDILKYFS
jgi:CBS domain-containing protein